MPISVKEVITAAAVLIGAGDLAKEAESGQAPQSEELALLVRCFNLVENEVALDYFPLKKKETFTPESGKIVYTRFSEAPVDICKVTSPSGRGVSFDIFATHIDVGSYTGSVSVTYAFAPKVKTIGGNSDHGGKISVRLLAYGVAAEYLLACARYTEAAAFDKKYRDALVAANNARRKLTVRSRRWA